MLDYMIAVHFRKYIRFAERKSSYALYWVRSDNEDMAKKRAIKEGKIQYNKTAFLASVKMTRSVNETAKYPILL